ncbi:kazal-type serine protease inhibitor domain-containing protein [Phthorimaea operculella]|nr:kazal-type serine protease inhibitor domain-containing protein [Phthorimaea operculella]
MVRSAKWWILTISVFTLTFLPPIKSSNIRQRYFKFLNDYMASGKVCGSDNVTYANRCELEHARSEDNPNLVVRYLGKCVAKKDTKCDDLDPVCGNDYLSYKNICQFQIARAKRPFLKMVHTGPCLRLYGWAEKFFSGVSPWYPQVDCRYLNT